MRLRGFCSFLLCCLLSISCRHPDASSTALNSARTFEVTGVVKQVNADAKTLLVKHDEIPGYMTAMTMPFKVRNATNFAGLGAGDKIVFQLSVTEEESWISNIRRIGHEPSSATPIPIVSAPKTNSSSSTHPLRDFAFTNELGRPVRLSDFRGQALAITFFFTRCPIPDFCPRLSRNFEEASRKLATLPSGPTNYHFLSVSFDTAFDTPSVLKAYAERYHYDQKHWSFLTGPQEKINELAQLSGVTFDKDGAGLFNHGFRTLIIDSKNRLQMSFPIGGNLADAIVSEMLKAANPTKE